MTSEPSELPPHDRPTIILVNSGYHLYREYLLNLVAGAARVWLFLDREPTWETRYIAGSTVVDTLDAAAMTAAARELAQRHRVDGVLCWDEVRMVPSSLLAAALGVPGGDPEAIANCRDKHRTRTVLAAAGVPQPQSVLVSSYEQASAVAERIGYPVVLKPRALGASFGVVGVSAPGELEWAFRHSREAFEDGVPYYEEGVLVEQYLSGEEISVDSVVVGGVLTPMFLARKDSGYPPYFEEVGHSVDADDPLLADAELLAMLAAAHRAVGLRNGITHTELRLTADGPRIIEINCRLGGDFIPYVGYLASGIDPGRHAVDAACARPPRVAATRHGVAAVRFCYPEREVTVERVEVDADALPPEVEVAGVLAGPGQLLSPPPDGHVTSRYGYAVARGASAADCARALETAAAAFTLHATPTGAAQPAPAQAPPAEPAPVQAPPAQVAPAQAPPAETPPAPAYAPGIAEFIDRCNAAMPPDFYTYPVRRQRELYLGLTEEFPYRVPAGLTITDDAVTHDGRALPVRVYRPDAVRGPGVLLYIRGGGFVVGSLDTHHTVVAELAANSGLLAVALDFRMAPEHPFPAAVEDCYGALCGLVTGAGRLGFDPERVVACGDSSGANMAVVLAMMCRDRGGPVLRGQALISPVLDFTRWRQGGADAPLLTGGEMEYYTRCYCPDPKAVAAPYVSPLVSGEFHGLPPAYIMGAELDSLLVDSQEYADRLRANGTPVELVAEPGLVHSAVRARGLSPRVAAAWLEFGHRAAGLAATPDPRNGHQLAMATQRGRS